jgi:uncharacterized protein (UPF0210 family)
MLRKSISGKLMNEGKQGSEGKAKKKGIRFAGDEEDQENVVDDEVKISDETTEKMKAMEAEIEKLKKWISSKRASVLPADHQAASAAEQKVRARVAEMDKIKED